MQPSTSPRHFNLGDLAIVVAAATVFFTLARFIWDHRDSSLDGFASPRRINSGPFFSFAPEARADIAGAGLVVVGWTLIGLRLRRPRPKLRRLLRQPGMVAASAASLALAVTWFRDRLSAQGGAGWVPAYRPVVFPDGASLAGCVAVLVAWALLLGSGRWQPERSWLDRTGRFLGWVWLLQPVGPLVGRLLGILP